MAGDGDDAYQEMAVLPVLTIATQVATITTAAGAETGMLLAIETPVGELVFVMSTAGVPVLKEAITDWERGLRGYIAGTGEAIPVMQLEA